VPPGRGPAPTAPSILSVLANAGGSRVPNLKVLIAYEEAYLAYAEVLGVAVGYAEPFSEVRVVPPRELEAEVSSFGPHLVVSSLPTDVFPDVEAWFTLSAEPDEPSEFRLGGRHWICVNPDLGYLGRVVDAVGGLVRDGRDPAVP
jgi:hypothetical protein